MGWPVPLFSLIPKKCTIAHNNKSNKEMNALLVWNRVLLFTFFTFEPGFNFGRGPLLMGHFPTYLFPYEINKLESVPSTRNPGRVLNPHFCRSRVRMALFYLSGFVIFVNIISFLRSKILRRLVSCRIFLGSVKVRCIISIINSVTTSHHTPLLALLVRGVNAEWYQCWIFWRRISAFIHPNSNFLVFTIMI